MKKSKFKIRNLKILARDLPTSKAPGACFRATRAARLHRFEFLISIFEFSPAFTLLELLVAITVIAILFSVSLAGMGQLISIAQGAYCANSLRQLGGATNFYLADHQHTCFQYSQVEPTGRLWYFGFETYSSINSPEGERTVDETQSPLYPYINQVGGVEICPSFPYGQAIWKPKYKGASWGYGFNTFLSGENLLTINHPSQVMLFGDCAQVNTWQSPASQSNPMLEEFYMLEDSSVDLQTIHFRHGSCANILFLDGHVEKFTMYPGTLNTILPSATVGRITPFGSMQYLQ